MKFAPVAFSALIATTLALIPQDEVTSLPGYNGALPSRHFSGYFPTGSATGIKGNLHYWLIQSESDPDHDPVVLWLNGGPGSSSLIGLLTENGQIATNDDSFVNKSSSGLPQPLYNPYSWSKFANMLYLEQPKGVGFSYCFDGPNNCENTDESTAIDAHEFLVNFFNGYPEFKSNDFYITGESYAGVYIPMLMDQIDKQGILTNFKGAAIGNGCWGSSCFDGIDQDEINYYVFSGHAMISQSLSEKIVEDCNFPNGGHKSDSCKKEIDTMYNQVDAFNVYNIYDVCASDQLRTEYKLGAIRHIMSETTTTRLRTTFDSFHVHPRLTGALNDFKCGGQTAMSAYLADPSVMEALHVNTTLSGMNYEQTAGDLRPLYKRLIEKYRVLIYSGDVDGCVPYWGTEKWTRGLNFTVKRDWHAWKSDSSEHKGEVVAGYAIEYDRFTLATVKGAGHMVPTFKPAFALSLFKRFLKNEPF